MWHHCSLCCVGDLAGPTTLQSPVFHYRAQHWSLQSRLGSFLPGHFYVSTSCPAYVSGPALIVPSPFHVYLEWFARPTHWCTYIALLKRNEFLRMFTNPFTSGTGFKSLWPRVKCRYETPKLSSHCYFTAGGLQKKPLSKPVSNHAYSIYVWPCNKGESEYMSIWESTCACTQGRRKELYQIAITCSASRDQILTWVAEEPA